MAFDYKKEYKEFYLPPAKPQIVTVPKMQFVAVRGKGNPNEETGEYKTALELLYGISYTIKMSKMGDHRIDGYFDYSNKDEFQWISLIRLPDFVSKKDFDWAKETATIKLMDDFAAEQGYMLDFSETRNHHEIYLSDPRKVAPEKLRTVIRHPIK